MIARTNLQESGPDQGAFTLVELLVAMVILSLILVVIAGVASSARQAWSNGEQRAEVYQNGRAILELITRELRHAVITPKLQFIQNPALNNGNQPNNSPYPLPNSHNIFWQANLTSTLDGTLCEVGYYLNTNNELKRFFVRPDDVQPDGTSNYQIFKQGYIGTSDTGSNAAAWVTNYLSNPTLLPKLSSTVSGGVLGFWVRCLDTNGDPIPYAPDPNNNIKFNSADRFQPAVPGVRTTDFSDAATNPSSFRYTASSTAQAHALPNSVELFVLTVDRVTDLRLREQLKSKQPNNPYLDQSKVPNNVTASPAPVGLPDNVTSYQEYLRQSFGIKSAQVFHSRVPLGAN